jgi:hypothetical protein
VDVRDRHDVVEVHRRVADPHAAHVHREQRVARDHVQRRVDIGQARRARNPPQPPLRFLHSDDVGVGRADGGADRVEVHLHAAV